MKKRIDTFFMLRLIALLAISTAISGCLVADGLRLNIDPVGWCMTNYDFYPPAERKVYCETTFLEERGQARRVAAAEPRSSIMDINIPTAPPNTPSRTSSATTGTIPFHAPASGGRPASTGGSGGANAGGSTVGGAQQGRIHNPANVALHCISFVRERAYSSIVMKNNCAYPVSVLWPQGIVNLDPGRGYPSNEQGQFQYFACRYGGPNNRAGLYQSAQMRASNTFVCHD